MDWTGSMRRGVALCCLALLPWAAAAAGAPTVEQLLAEEDQSLINQMTDWDKRAFAVPEDLNLDTALREASTNLSQEHLRHMQTLWPAWIAEERAASGSPGLRGRALSMRIYQRALNEMAIWTIESSGPAYDEAWVKAALAPTACSFLHPAHFARRLAMIRVAPMDARPALLAGERELLSRWGTKRPALPTRPSATELEAADHAIAQMRAGMPVNALPMTPSLAGKLFELDRKPDKPNRWEQCAKSRWWLASQLAGGKIDRTAAMNLYRHSTMFDVLDEVPDEVMETAKAASALAGEQTYPPAASYFRVEGSTTIQVDISAEGKALNSRIVSRKIKVPGVRDNRPVAFEALLDQAALDYASKRSYPVGKATKGQFEMVWNLKEEAR
jgi:hypothetical protein